MLTTEKILDTAEDVLRRFGPRKTTVVDIARELKVSHGTVYRHFESKSALHSAITKRWLERATLPLLDIVKKPTTQTSKLREWFETLMDIKIQKSLDDPEMFASYLLLAQKLPEHVIFEHLEVLIKQVEEILEEGKKNGVFDVEDCAKTAHTLFFATIRYHHPLHASEWSNTTIKDDFNHLFTLLEKALHK
jgi:AcrR family transcriptional regulator